MRTPEDLAPIYQQISSAVTQKLPQVIAERLRWNRKPRLHKDKNDMILFNVRDKFQAGLELDQFNYCLNYHPLRPDPDGTIWILHLRCNMQRIRKMVPNIRDVMRLELRHLKHVCPPQFVYQENIQTVELRYSFNFVHPLAKLPDFLIPRYLELITAAHPVLVRAIDIFHGKTPKEIKPNEIGDLPSKPRQIWKDLAIYGAQPTAAMQPVILDRYDHKCAFCGKPVAEGDLEFHHLKFRSKGGLRVVDNFAPLHVACHDEVHRLSDKDGVLPKGTLRCPSTK